MTSPNQSTDPTLSTSEKSRVALFFLRVRNIYGNRLFEQEWPDDKTLALAKREHADKILHYTDDELDAKLNRLFTEVQNDTVQYRRPNIAKILGIKAGLSPTGINSQAYLPHKSTLPTPEQMDAARRSPRVARIRAEIHAMLEEDNETNEQERNAAPAAGDPDTGISGEGWEDTVDTSWLGEGAEPAGPEGGLGPLQAQ